MTTNPNNIILLDNRLIFPRFFRNKQWGEQFGIIQKELETYQNEKIIVDFSQLEWIDPLPLLSLQITLHRIENILIELHLPEVDRNSLENNNLLAFLYSEGFLDQFPENSIVYSGSSKVNDYSIYEDYVDTLRYANCSIIKAHVIDLNKELSRSDYGIYNWISDIVSSSQFHIRNKVESYVSQEVVERLRTLLSETISNVFEHAYGGEKKKHVGFYVRFRIGLGNTRVRKNEYLSLKRLIGFEHLNSPKLDRYFIDNVFSFIEVFIIDSGCGLAANYFDNSSQKIHPFREAWRLGVFRGQRGLNTEGKKTQFGGLYHIYKKLGNNYIWARDCDEWIGHEAPSQEEGSFYEDIEGNNTPIRGLAIIYRLTWDVASDEEEHWTRIDTSINIENGFNSSNHPFLHELCQSISIYDRDYDNKILRDSYYVVDNRFNRKDNFYKNNPENAYCCFYFPKKYLQKNEVFETINGIFQNVKSKRRTLIICDILVFEANLFQLAIENAAFSDTFCSNFDQIILVSERFSTLILNKDTTSNKFQSSNLYVSQSTKKTKFSPVDNLLDIIAWIRTHDSILFWEIIKSKTKEGHRLYENSPILWYSGDVNYNMNGYLNFSQAISDSDIKKIIETSLRRVSCFAKQGDPNSVEYLNIDVLTSQLSSQTNQQFLFAAGNKEDSNIKILLGSVFVSGMSQFDKEYSLKSNKYIPIHFFLHKSVYNLQTETYLNTENVSNHPHLFLWPTEWLKKQFPFNDRKYRRVGRSHVIAPFGWKYYPIPRFRVFSKKEGRFLNSLTTLSYKSSNDYEFICAYGDTPRNSYREWQMNPQFIEIGHFSYENKHDLFKINFPLIVQESFNEGGPLAVFLLAEFLMALNLSEKEINGLPESSISVKKGKTKIISSIFERRVINLQNRVKNYCSKNNSGGNCALIVYPSHYHSEDIVGKIKDCIDSKHHDRIIPLIPINVERGSSSYLISPFTLEDIRNKINHHKQKYNTAEVLLFDEATIGGKTRKELKHLLFYLGADNVKTLCILDRRRLPLSTTIPEKHKAFWRLDIPRLGNKGECILCETFKSITSLENQLIYTTHKHRIQEWKEIWVCNFQYSKGKNHGIPARPLKRIINKKFSLYIDQDTGQSIFNDEISIINSLGLILYSAEIHSMTARYDMALELCLNPEIDNHIKISLLSVNLLLFNRDFSDFIISEMVSSLINLIDQEEECNETALGVLSILSIPQSIVHKVIYPIIDKQNDISNRDLNLLYSNYVLNNQDRFIDNKLNNNFSNSYTKNEKIAYHKLHHEIYNDFGINHNKAFQKLLNLKESSIINHKLIDEGLASGNRLLEIVKGFPIENTRRYIGKDKIEEIKIGLIAINTNLENHLKSISASSIPKYYSEDPEVLNELSTIQSIVHFVSQKIYEIHNLLFIKIGVREPSSFPLYDSLLQLIEEHNKVKEHRVGFSNNFIKAKGVEHEKWIIWDRHILKKIEYIFGNARHVFGYIDKYRKFHQNDSNNFNEIFRMVLSVKYNDNGISLIFENFSETSATYIIEESNKKRKLEKEHIQNLGGSLNYTDSEQKNGLFLINTILFLPYP